jgi:transposase
VNKVTVVGLDLAKSMFQVHGVDARGHAVLRKSMRRSEVMKVFSQLPICLVGMEACNSAHHWGRKLQALGHEVRLIPPQYVKPTSRPTRPMRRMPRRSAKR